MSEKDCPTCGKPKGNDEFGDPRCNGRADCPLCHGHPTPPAQTDAPKPDVCGACGHDDPHDMGGFEWCRNNLGHDPTKSAGCLCTADRRTIAELRADVARLEKEAVCGHVYATPRERAEGGSELVCDGCGRIIGHENKPAFDARIRFESERDATIAELRAELEAIREALLGGLTPSLRNIKDLPGVVVEMKRLQHSEIDYRDEQIAAQAAEIAQRTKERDAAVSKLLDRNTLLGIYEEKHAAQSKRIEELELLLKDTREMRAMQKEADHE